jgi:hypothetical protein
VPRESFISEYHAELARQVNQTLNRDYKQSWSAVACTAVEESRFSAA